MDSARDTSWVQRALLVLAAGSAIFSTYMVATTPRFWKQAEAAPPALVPRAVPLSVPRLDVKATQPIPLPR